MKKTCLEGRLEMIFLVDFYKRSMVVEVWMISAYGFVESGCINRFGIGSLEILINKCCELFLNALENHEVEAGAANYERSSYYHYAFS